MVKLNKVIVGLTIILVSGLTTLCLLLINNRNKHNIMVAPQAEVINPCDSLVASQQASINTINDDYKRLLILVGKYEMALDAIRYTDHEAYRQFIRHAQFAEQYTAEREDEFYKENLKYK